MSENIQDLEKRMIARRADIHLGKRFEGISPNVDPETPPSWYDPVAFKHAQTLFQTYKVIIRISQLYGLNLVLYHTTGLLPLLVTGNSENVSKLFTRYLSTLLHVDNWFEHDPFDKKSKAYRSLKLVRGLHRQVASKMNKASNRQEDGKSILWINQYGMCNAQFSFVGFMTVFPKELGFHNFTPKDFHAMFHFWRVIGYCLGIDDRFNLCNGTDEEIFELCRQIYFKEWLPVIQEGSEKTGIEMSKGICLAMNRINPNLNYNCLMRYASDFLQLDKDNFKLETTREKVTYVMILILFRCATRFKFQNWLLAKITDIRMNRAIANKSWHKKDLQEKYSDIQYTNDRCPFDVNFDYVDVFEMK